MRKEVVTKNGTVELVCNAATPYVVKKIFGVDILTALANIESEETGKKIEVLEQMAFTMAKQAKMSTREAMDINPDQIIDWLAAFDFDDMTDNIVSVALDLWMFSGKAQSQEKNPSDPQ